MQAPPDIEAIKAKIHNLPMVDTDVYGLIALLNNPATNFEQIVRKISPGVATRFLTIANSAYYGREVRTIQHAVRLLGFTEMRQVLVTSVMLEHFVRQLDVSTFNFQKFQSQAQFCAVVARALGQIMNYDQASDLFTVALLHNIGKLIIAVYFKEAHREIVDLKLNGKLSSREAEMQVLGTTHAELGAEMLVHFKIPPDICDAVRYHDSYERDVPPEGNYQLELISREATRIVGQFRLPDHIEAMALNDRLQRTIVMGREMFREGMRTGLVSKGFKENFTQLLEQSSQLVYQALKREIPMRHCQSDGDAAPAEASDDQDGYECLHV